MSHGDSDNYYQQLIQTIPSVIVQLTSKGNIIDINNEAEKVFECKRDEVIGSDYFDMFLPEKVRKNVAEDINKVLSGKETRNFEYPIKSKTRKEYLFSWNVSRLQLGNGEKGIIAIGQDITEYIKIKDALKYERDKAQKYLDIAGVIIVIINSEGVITLINQRGCEILGYEQKEILGKNWFDNFLAARLKKEVKSVFLKLMSGEIEPVEYFENPVITACGQERIIAWHNTTLTDENGLITGTMSSGEDVTEKRLAEKALRESELKWRSLVENAPNIISIIDRNGVIHFINRTVTGIPVEQVIGSSIYKYTSEEYHHIIRRTIEYVFKTGETASYETSGTGPNQREAWYVTLVGPFTQTDYVTEVLMISTDISDLKEAEEKIKASLREKEILLKEIHHRVKNNLQVISSLIRLQSGSIKDLETLSMFQKTRDRVKTIALVHEKLYGAVDLSQIDFIGYTKSLLRGLYQSYISGVEDIQMNIEGESIFIDINKAVSLGLIINELYTNAIKHAFPPSFGRHKAIKISLQKKDRKLFLKVGDTGIGLPHNFDLNNKTESLGLYLVKILVEDQLKGEIKIIRNRGTTYEITLDEI